MNLRDLLYVIAVAEHKNFTRAAKVTNVSQPALSNQIKKLEAELGLEIFTRGKNEVILTEFGDEFSSIARQISGLVDAANDLARKHGKVDAVPLRLGVTPTLAAYLYGYFRELFAELIPGMGLIIVEEYPTKLVEMTVEKSIDMALIARKSYNSIVVSARRQIDFTPLWLEPLFLGVRQGHPLTRKPSIWANEVPQDLLIRFDTSFGYDLESDLPRPSKEAADLVGIDARSARFETVCRHVAQSDACTMINAIAADQFKRDGFGLDFIPFDDEGNTRELGAVVRPEYPHPKLVEAMRSAIQDTPPPGTLATQQAAEVLEKVLNQG